MLYHCAKGQSSPCFVRAAADAVQAAPTTQRSDRMRSGPRVRRANKQAAELARLRAAAGPPSLEGPKVIRHDTEQDEVGFAGSA